MRLLRVWSLLCLGVGVACGGKVPDIRYYELDVRAPAGSGARAAATALPVLAVEPFAADTAYDDNRMVYRESSVRLDYYYYHRWSAPPGTLIADEMRTAYFETTGAAQSRSTKQRDGRQSASVRPLAAVACPPLGVPALRDILFHAIRRTCLTR